MDEDNVGNVLRKINRDRKKSQAGRGKLWLVDVIVESLCAGFMMLGAGIKLHHSPDLMWPLMFVVALFYGIWSRMMLKFHR